MRYVRFLIPLVLLAVAVPASAVCGYCDEWAACVPLRGLWQRCHYDFPDYCTIWCVEAYGPNCGPTRAAAPSAFSNDFRILAVKVEAPKAAVVGQESTVVPQKKPKKTT